MLIKIFFSLIIALLVWQGLNILHIFLKRQFLIVSDEVVKRNEKLWEQCLLLTGKQVKIITTLIRNVALWWFKKKADEQLQVRKGTVLQNVVNHLNQNLSHDLQLKTINPATTGGIDIWVYLANNLNDDEQLSLERRILGLISFYDTDAEAYFLDFKADEEMFSMTGDHVARGFDCLELFETVYRRFESRLKKQEESSHNLYLIFDEWQAFLAYLEQTDKKKHKEVLSKMLMMNSMGRSLGCRILLSSQRFLLSELPGRYNFNCIISLSTSFLLAANNRQLLFPDMEKDEVVVKPRGYGYFQLEGEPVKMFRTIQVRDEERLNQRIQELFSRYS